MWFAVMLLLFDIGYVAWRLGTKRGATRPAGNAALPGYRAIGGFIVALALTSYLIRIVLPMGSYWPRTAVLNFPSLAYLPQYVSFLVLGTIAYRRDWLRAIPDASGKAGFLAALVATLLLWPAAFAGGAAFLGGGNWHAAAYALWDSIFSIGISLALIVLFRRRFDRQGRLGRFLSGQAYAVYVVHIPVIVLLALALRGLQLEHLVKFGLTAIVGVPLCFAVAGMFGAGTQVRVVGDAGHLIETVRALPFVRDVTASENSLSVGLDHPDDQNPALVRSLVAAGADIRAVEPTSHSLEEVYLELVEQAREAAAISH